MTFQASSSQYKVSLINPEIMSEPCNLFQTFIVHYDYEKAIRNCSQSKVVMAEGEQFLQYTIRCRRFKVMMAEGEQFLQYTIRCSRFKVMMAEGEQFLQYTIRCRSVQSDDGIGRTIPPVLSGAGQSKAMNA